MRDVACQVYSIPCGRRRADDDDAGGREGHVNKQPVVGGPTGQVTQEFMEAEWDALEFEICNLLGMHEYGGEWVGGGLEAGVVQSTGHDA